MNVEVGRRMRLGFVSDMDSLEGTHWHKQRIESNLKNTYEEMSQCGLTSSDINLPTYPRSKDCWADIK